MATICLDFDDTLCAHDGSPLPGAAAALNALRAEGHRLLVSSARFSPIYGELNRFRVQKVRDWLRVQGIEVDAITLVVPQADLYVDDLAYRFGTTWEDELEPILDRLSPLWRKAQRKLDRSLSVALDCVWAGEVAEGAEAALARLETLGVQVALSAGPQLAPEGHEARPNRPLREQLRAAGLTFARVDAEKIASHLYVSPRALRFAGDWSQTLAEVRERLTQQRDG